MTPHDILRKYYGYRSFRTHQLDIIESVIRGQDAFDDIQLMGAEGVVAVVFAEDVVRRHGTGGFPKG